MAEAADVRELAAELSSASDAALAELFRVRRVGEPAWRDFFDAAESLLTEDSLLRGLARVDLSLLRAVRDGRAERSDRTLGLIGGSGRPFSSVAALLDAHPLPPAVSASPRAARPEDAAHASERAFATVRLLADVLLLLAETPLAVRADESLSVSSRKALSDETGEASAPDAAQLARIAGFVRVRHDRLRLTESGERWLHLPTAERWERLCAAVVAALPPALRDGAHWRPLDAWATAYPLDPAWPEEEARLRGHLVALGLVLPDGAEPAWARSRRPDGAFDAELVGLPGEVDRLYIQNDLSAIAPGPLAAIPDLRLRTMAEPERSSQASLYRFSEASLDRALALGETPESIRVFLRDVSLTGIPQPLDYLIARAGERHGLLRVAPNGAGTILTSADPALLDTVLIDQTLSPLGLRRGEEGLLSRVSPDTVHWALVDARYPALAIDASGEPLAPRARAIPDASPESSREAPVALITRLRAATEGESAWLTREIERAVRARRPLRLTIRMADASERVIVAEPIGIGGGRVRVRDRAADVERTVPLSGIADVADVTD